MNQTILTNTDEQYSPPELPVLRVEVIGGVAFLEIAKYDETHEQTTMTRIETISVDAAALVHAITNSAISDARPAKKAADNQQEVIK